MIPQTTKFIQLSLEGEQLATFDTTTEAAKAVEGRADSVRRACRHESNYKNFKWKMIKVDVDLLEDEEFKQSKDFPRYLISNKMRVWSIQADKFVTSDRITSKKSVSAMIKHVVAKLFNLETTSPKEIVQYDSDCQEVARFPSFTQAGKATGISRARISRSCHGKSNLKINGFYWRFDGDEVIRETNKNAIIRKGECTVISTRMQKHVHEGEPAPTQLPNFPGYTIFSDGRVHSKYKNRDDGFIKFSSRNGYMYAKLNDNENKRVNIGQHQLVARAFIPNPNNLPIVNHKDGDGYNNHHTNLEWVSASENTQHAHDTNLVNVSATEVIQYSKTGKEIARYESIVRAAEVIGGKSECISRVCRGVRGSYKGFDWKYASLKSVFDVKEEEEWREIPGHDSYLASSLGRVWSTKTNKYMKPAHRKDGYLRLHLDKKSWYVHRLIAFTFLEKPPREDFVVNHKDGNKKNNCVENIEWISFNQNVQHAFTTGLNSTRSVDQYSPDGEYLRTYNNCAEAAKEMGISHNSISQHCKQEVCKYKTKGFYWRYKGDELKFVERPKYNLEGTKTRVDQYTLDCEFVKTFDSVTEAAEAVGMKDTSSISHVLTGKIKTAGGWQWRRFGDPPPTQPVKSATKKVRQLTKDGQEVKVWNTITEAAKELGIQGSHISGVCKGKRKTTGGWKWEYC